MGSEMCIRDSVNGQVHWLPCDSVKSLNWQNRYSPSKRDLLVVFTWRSTCRTVIFRHRMNVLVKLCLSGLSDAGQEVEESR